MPESKDIQVSERERGKGKAAERTGLATGVEDPTGRLAVVMSAARHGELLARLKDLGADLDLGRLDGAKQKLQGVCALIHDISARE